MDGAAALDDLARAAGYSVVELLVRNTLFLHPDTVKQTGGRALFPIVRVRGDRRDRGTFTKIGGRDVVFDDNQAPTLAFLWAAGRSRGKDVQYNHIWLAADDPDAYTALWNVCVTPAFLAKLTDGAKHPDTVSVLQYRSWELYGHRPAETPEPQRPDGYDRLAALWPEPPPPIGDLEATIRSGLGSWRSSRANLAARTIGWLFSDGPDALLGAGP